MNPVVTAARSTQAGKHDGERIEAGPTGTPRLDERRADADRRITYDVPFAILFEAEMSGAEVALMVSELGMTFHSHPKLSFEFLAFVRLDAASGLFLLREPEGLWRLECRTYGHPSAQVLDAWKAHAAWVVGRIDADRR